VFLFSAQQSFVLANDLETVPVDAAHVCTSTAVKIAHLGDGDDYVQIGGFVRLNPVSGGLLADVLPPLIHVRATSPQATVLHWLLDQPSRIQWLSDLIRLEIALWDQINSRLHEEHDLSLPSSPCSLENVTASPELSYPAS